MNRQSSTARSTISTEYDEPQYDEFGNLIPGNNQDRDMENQDQTLDYGRTIEGQQLEPLVQYNGQHVAANLYPETPWHSYPPPPLPE